MTFFRVNFWNQNAWHHFDDYGHAFSSSVEEIANKLRDLFQYVEVWEITTNDDQIETNRVRITSL